MLNTSNLTTIVSVYKLCKRTALSAMTLIAFLPLAEAADSNRHNKNPAKDNPSTINYCYDNKVKPNARLQYQLSEPQTIDCMLTKLASYQQNPLTVRQQYFAYKAQAWLNYASYENRIKSHSSAGRQALEAAATILQKLQSNADEELRLTTDIPSTSALMRPDLWAVISALKGSASTNSDNKIIAPRELAFSEVALIWAAADQCAHGRRESGTHFRMAERWLEQAREAYVNAHDSKTNVALENSIVDYYKQYVPLDPQDDICRGQSLSLTSHTSNINDVKNSSLTQSITLNMTMPTAKYSIGHNTIKHLIN
ncbi:hypothetical protein AAIR29_03720 [Psychrobacter sp. FBL11]|uniref:Lysozyme inhibitor LprI N-terminal domain-containing protein n=1 Tax=Psychrobacter saeujeotis TaxID=3143436 RepID=A0ABU9X5R5_9GAMM|nr:hypothetical protein [uncultured Psychrobacter sp.]